MKAYRDIRWRAALTAVLGVVIAGAAFSLLPGAGIDAPTVEPRMEAPRAGAPVAASVAPPSKYGQDDKKPAATRSGEIERRFRQGVMMLHSGRHDYAVTAFHRVLELEPRLPEAHANMGFALLGLDQDAAARDFFQSAIELRPEQVNAYYGLALTWERVCDIAAARGAMRTYLHLTPADDPYVRKARAALWEWEGPPVAGKCEGGRGTGS